MLPEPNDRQSRPASASASPDLIRYVVEQAVQLERDLADCLHDLSLRIGEEGRADEAADYRDASIRHRVRALEMQAMLAAAGPALAAGADAGERGEGAATTRPGTSR